MTNAAHTGACVNHYPRHIGDWMTATAHLTEIEECIYSRMMDQYYARESPLPLDIAACCRLVRASTAAARKAVPSVLREFFTEAPDGWHQKRCDEELMRFNERSEAARASAMVSVEARRQRANAERTLSERSANAQTNVELTNSHKPLSSKARAKPTREHRPLALPDWLLPAAWERWSKHRGRKLTSQAIALQIGKLADLRAAGHAPEAMIDLAIESGWATFYPPRGSNGNGSGKGPRMQSIATAMYGSVIDERNRASPSERDVSAESKRVA